MRIAYSTPSEVQLDTALRSPTSSPLSATLRLHWDQPLAVLPLTLCRWPPFLRGSGCFLRSVTTRGPSHGLVTTPHAPAVPCTAGKLHTDSGVDGSRDGTYLLQSRGGVYPAGPGRDSTWRGGRDETQSDGRRKGRNDGTGYAAQDMTRPAKWADPALRRERERERERAREREIERERESARAHAGERERGRERARKKGIAREREREVRREREERTGARRPGARASERERDS